MKPNVLLYLICTKKLKEPFWCVADGVKKISEYLYISTLGAARIHSSVKFEVKKFEESINLDFTKYKVLGKENLYTFHKIGFAK